MTTTTATTDRFDMSRVISRTFSAIGKNLPTFSILTVMLYAVPQALIQWGFALAGSGNGALAGLLSLVGGIASLFLTFVLQACLVHGTVANLRGQPANLGKALSTGFGSILSLWGLSILMGLGEGLGLMLLFVPGLILMTRWSVAVPTLVVERSRGISGSMGRSADLTKGHRWSIFGLILIVWILSWIVSMVGLSVAHSVDAAFGMAAAPDAAPASAPDFLKSFQLARSPLGIAVHTLFSSIVLMIGAVGAASLYYELRSLKEGIGAHDLAAVFD